MDALLWKRIGELFDAARELEGADRVKFLKEQCGDDPALLEQVQSLLDADTKRGPLDSRPTASALPVPAVVAGRFRIIRYIAEGGMGTVYEAEDLRLNDRVALKTIRPDIASDPKVVERFKREILLAKKVTHLNVCRIHDLGVDRFETGQEFLFLTMQFLGGETLASRIKRGPMPQTEALPLIEDMTDALSAAHQAEVVHRDFKSGNVMLVNGANRIRAVVTDFGLARGSHDNRSLHAGLVGTVDYMAPEQIKGEEITPASDIYALGVVMYEMVTGQRPFTGDSNMAVATKHLNDQPQSPRDLAPELDSNWDDVILSCMRKLPKQRFQSAAEIKAALVQNGTKSRRRVISRRQKSMLVLVALSFVALGGLILAIFPQTRQPAVAVASWIHGGLFAPAPLHSILVTDLLNKTGDSLFDHSLRELLTTTLEQSPFLKVYPTSTLPDVLRRMNLPADQTITESVGLDICKREGVEAAIVGSISRFGSEFTLAIKAVTPQGEVIASDVETASTIGVFPEVIEKAASRIRRKLGESPASLLKYSTPLEKVTSPSLQALQVYSEGKARLYEGNPQEAVRLFDRALDLDPHFAMAREYLGVSYNMLGDSERSRDNYLEATRLADDVTDRERMKIFGDYFVQVQNYDQAISYFTSMSTAYPSDGPAHLNLGQSYLGKYRFDIALAETKLGLNLQPGVGPQNNLAEINFLSGDTRESLRTTQSILTAHPHDLRALYNLGRCDLVTGNIAEARKAFEELVRLGGDEESRGRAGLADIELAEGHYEQANAQLVRGVALDKKLRNRFAANAKLILLGETYRQQGRKREFESTMEQVDIRDRDPLLIFLAGSLVARAGDLVRARRYLHSFDSIEDQFQTSVAYALANLLRAEIAMAEGNGRGTVDAAQEAIGFDKSTLALQVLARAYEAAGSYNESIREYDEMLARRNERVETYDGPAFHEVVAADYRLGILYEKTGNMSKAREHFASFLRQWPQPDPRAPFYREARSRLLSFVDEGRRNPTPAM